MLSTQHHFYESTYMKSGAGSIVRTEGGGLVDAELCIGILDYRRVCVVEVRHIELRKIGISLGM